MFKSSGRYWFCQFAGWGGWALVNLFFALQFASDIYLHPEAKRNLFFFALFLDFFWSILLTHLLRLVLKRIGWMKLPFAKIAAVFVVGTISVGLMEYYAFKITSDVTDLSFEKYSNNEQKQKAISMEKEMQVANTEYYDYLSKGTVDSTSLIAFNKIKKSTGWHRDKKGEWQYEEPRKGKDFWGILITFILMALWLLIYFIWHYINKNRNDHIDKLQLEAMVKSLELKTIKSHINPHFIFNAHNSIRALVDENPERARQAITELSNILRSSMQAEKMETVPLQHELNIVKDYLALEHMRFEDRLKIEMAIDEDTLSQTVPPMMLQTLVENAIKHGISKRMNGGTVKIISAYKNGHHELIVQNSGSLNGYQVSRKEGFGITSTHERLNLLYQGKANFEMHEIDGGMVESKIIMPVVSK
ncbi:MAG: histidine kinase [Ferruginibacter sp.]